MTRVFPITGIDFLPLLVYSLVYSVFLMDTVFACSERRTVNCTAGLITGSTRTVNIGPSRTANITEFLGIPYAEPPVGKNRFLKPVKKRRFSDELLALKFGASCPQFNPLFTPETMSEDCLFLNVYTPFTMKHRNEQGEENNTNITAEEHMNLLTSPENTTLLPVMVWIHGGGFIIGDGSIFDGGKLAAYGQVVVVTLNYRLGPFGFLNTGDLTMDGNNGLRDQQLAIMWVNENIEYFGGDTSMVTIFGESSGAAAVMYQMIYPPNGQLIHRVIAESGSANANWALVPNPGEKAKQFASKLNCPVSAKMIQCLREQRNLTKMAIASDLGGQDWNPSLDNDFVTLGRIQALDDAATLKSSLPHLQQIDLMMGTNGFDGQSFLTIPLYLQEYLSITNKSTPLDHIRTMNRNIYLKALKKLYSADVARKILDPVDFEYTYHEDPSDRNLNIKQSTDFMTDVQYLLPAFKSLESHAFNNTMSTTYQYEFNELFPFLSNELWVDGALHAQEMPYVFGLPRSLEKYFNYTQVEANRHWSFSTQVMDYWTNFVKTGNPNKPRITGVEWKTYQVTTRKYLYLTSGLTESRSYLHARHLNFLSKYMPRLISKINVESKGDNFKCPTTTNSGCRASFITIVLFSLSCFYTIM